LGFFDSELSEEYSADDLVHSDKNEFIQQIESGSEVENVIEAKEEITDEDSSEDSSEEDRYYADKAEKHCRNCNSTFESENELHQQLRFEIACIIWIVWIIRHFFAGSAYEAVIYMDHSSAIDIAKPKHSDVVQFRQAQSTLVRAGKESNVAA
jgi:hypothetical protein